MIVLDTTVLVYAVGADHRFRDPSRTLIDRVAAGRIRASTTVEVIQEFAHVRSRRRDRDDATRLALAFAELLAPLLTTTPADLRTGLELWRRHPRVGSFDAVLSATSMRAGARALISADAAFADIDGMAHLLPDADELGALEHVDPKQ